MLKMKYKFFICIMSILLSGIFSNSLSSAYELYRILVVIDGIFFELTKLEADDGTAYCYAEMQADSGFNPDQWNAPNGVLTIPSKVTYMDTEYVVTKISAQNSLPEFITEVIIPEDFGTYAPDRDYEYWCGLMDVEKMTILSNSIRFRPYSIDDIYYEKWKENYNRLEEVEIQSKYVVVEEHVFSNCNKLKTVTFNPEAEVTLERGSFTNCEKLESLVLPKKTEFKEGAVIQCENLKNISFYEKSDKYGFSDGGLVTRTEPKTLLYLNTEESAYQLPKRIETIGQFAFSSCPSLTTVRTTSNLRTINRYAFYECRNIKNVTLKNGLTSISSYAFQNCSLSKVTIPKTVTHLGEGVWWKNQKLKTITVEKGNPKYKSQSGMVLTKSGKTLKMAVGERNLKVPDGVTKVDSDFIARGKIVYSITYPKTLKVTGTLGNGDFAWGYRKPERKMKILYKVTFKGKNPPEVKDTLDYQRSIDHETWLYESLMIMEIPKGADKAKYKEFWQIYINGGEIVTI